MFYSIYGYVFYYYESAEILQYINLVDMFWNGFKSLFVVKSLCYKYYNKVRVSDVEDITMIN